MLPDILTFVDLETTGTSPTHDRVIEVGILRVEKGKIIEEFESLVDPGIYLPPEITYITGINASELEGAPTFRTVKEKVDKLTEGSIVVAHNAQFDMSFLKAEYERIGDRFKNKSLCSVKLSRFLFPRYKRHNLDSIIERFGIACDARHRAFGDAKVIWDFFKILKEQVEEKKLTGAIKTLLKKPSLPAGIKAKVVDRLPNKPGVYIFSGENGAPLYVGKSVNIHDRVVSHFNSTHKSGRELSIAQQINLIDHEVTEGEMEALLRERELIAEMQPLYNRQLRLTQKLTILKEKDLGGYRGLEMIESSQIDPSDFEKVLGVFKTKGKAKNALLEIADKYTLCHKLLGLENGKGACFRNQIEKCNGACVGRELAIKYNLRFIEAFSSLKLKQWPFEGPIVIKEGKKGHLVNKWCYIGLVDEYNFDETKDKNDLQFDYDTYKILVKFILKPEYAAKIKIL